MDETKIYMPLDRVKGYMLRFKISVCRLLRITENNTNAVMKRVCILKLYREVLNPWRFGSDGWYSLSADGEDAERDETKICRRWLLSGAVSRIFKDFL